MPTIFTEPDAPLAETLPRGRPTGLTTLGWSLTTGFCASAVWAVACLATRAAFALDQSFERISLDDVLPITASGSVAGGVVGVLVGISRRSGTRDRTLFGVGSAVLGALMGASVPLTVVATHGLLHPLLGTSLAMAGIGAVTGLCGPFAAMPATPDDALTESRPGALMALGWALAAGFGTALAWAATWLMVPTVFDLTEPFAWLTLDNLPMFGAMAAGYGCVSGALVGLCRRSGKRGETALILGIGGAVFGALMGSSVPLALTATQGYVSPLLASSFVVAVVGFLAGLCGHGFKPSPKPDENPFDEDSAAPAVTIEWLLREKGRPWRISRRLARVLPVLGIATGALTGAAFASSAALLAVGLLGVAMAHAIDRQERRIDALERRGSSGRDTPPSV